MASYYISHHGIKGQRWGVRRFQSKNGKLTTEEKLRRKRLDAFARKGKIRVAKTAVKKISNTVVMAGVAGIATTAITGIPYIAIPTAAVVVGARWYKHTHI